MIGCHLVSRIVVLAVFSLFATACSPGRSISVDSNNSTGDAAIVVVKFKEGTDIRLREGKLVSLSAGPLLELDTLLTQYAVEKIERQFTQPEEEIAQEQATLEIESGKDIPDLNLYFRLFLQNLEEADEFLEKLNSLEIVETAYMEASPAPPPAVK